MRRLIPSQFIGFTGLALLGRPGELVRPFLVARKEKLTFSSQLAVWAIERVFDISAVAILMGLSLAIWGDKFKAYPEVQTAGYLLLGLAAALALIFFLLWWRTGQIASLLDRLLRPRSEAVANTVCRKVRAFGQGLHTIRDLKSFLLHCHGLALPVGLHRASLHSGHACVSSHYRPSAGRLR